MMVRCQVKEGLANSLALQTSKHLRKLWPILQSASISR